MMKQFKGTHSYREYNKNIHASIAKAGLNAGLAYAFCIFVQTYTIHDHRKIICSNGAFV